MTPHSLSRVRLADRPWQPWPNGGGRARDLLVWPQAEPWRLRVSVAEIVRDAAFSHYPGIQRCFAILDGDGVELDLPGGTRAVLPLGDPLTFDGEAAPPCRLLGAPSQALNFMAPRGSGRARLARAAPGSQIDGDLAFRALFTDGPARFETGGHTEALHDATLLWTDQRDAEPWTLREGSRAYWLTLED